MNKIERTGVPVATATTNACKLCAPLGACLAFRGVAGAIPFLHGSQGCATYIRRYLISHFREPLDIASSSIDEASAIFGGSRNFQTGIKNVCLQYQPSLIGIATTCLSETIGEDVSLYVKQFYSEKSQVSPMPALVRVATPSYRGTHVEGYQAAVKALVEQLAMGGSRLKQINLLPGLVSPADLRLLKEILADFKIDAVVLPDYSETLDGPNWSEYHRIPPGGTPLARIRSMGRSAVTLELGDCLLAPTAGEFLVGRYQIPRYQIGVPVGVTATDRFMEVLCEVSGGKIPEKYQLERGRLIDSYVDGHKYLFNKRAVVYGDADLVAGLAGFLAEIGMIPVLCGTGSTAGHLATVIKTNLPALAERIAVREGADFAAIAAEVAALQPDLIIGNSKGYQIARQFGIPLIRVGFPIHDRIGGQRLLHLGYRGAQELFDRITNTLLEREQDLSPVGYSYL